MQPARIEQNAIFSILHPQTRLPALINSPHSGDRFPESFLAASQLSRETLRRASDLFVDRLTEPLAALGASVMRAHLPRSFLDLNREPFELDPRLIAGPLPAEANTRSLRVAGGLGTIPRVIGDQVEIYAGKLPLGEALRRIEQVHLPYHRRLTALLADLAAEHGGVVLIDCHSMPSNGSGRPARPLPDLVLGDRFGASAAPALVDTLEAIASRLGFRVERNQPYAGGYITEHYGHPAFGRHAIQIEINRAVYMNEAELQPHAGFVRIGETLFRLFAEFFASEAFLMCRSGLHSYQSAAE